MEAPETFPAFGTEYVRKDVAMRMAIEVPDLPRAMSADDIAEATGLARSMVVDAAARGELTKLRRNGEVRHVYYAADDVRRWFGVGPGEPLPKLLKPQAVVEMTGATVDSVYRAVKSGRLTKMPRNCASESIYVSVKEALVWGGMTEQPAA